MDWVLLAFLGALGVLGALLGRSITDSVRSKARVQRRMRPTSGLFTNDDSDSVVAKPAQNVAAQEGSVVAWLNGRFPLAGGVSTAILSLVVAVVTAGAVTPFLVFVGLSTPLAVLVGIGVACLVGWNLGKAKEDAKRTALNDRLLPALEDLQRMVRFGIPTMQALNSVAGTAEEPLKPVLRNVLLDAGLGVPLERALGQEAHRIGIGELAMLAAILSTQANTGGNLSEAVGNLAKMLRERKDNRLKAKAATAESRLTLIMLSVLPLLGVGAQAGVQPELLGVLVNEGRHLLGIGLAFIFSGLGISYLMIRSAGR